MSQQPTNQPVADVASTLSASEENDRLWKDKRAAARLRADIEYAMQRISAVHKAETEEILKRVDSLRYSCYHALPHEKGHQITLLSMHLNAVGINLDYAIHDGRYESY